MRWIILILIPFICGCAATTEIFRDEEGRVYKIESRGAVHTTIKEGDSHLEQDSKKEPFTLEIPLTKVGK